MLYWWTFRDSNPGPTGYEPVALTNWAKGPKKSVVTPTGFEPMLSPWKGGVLTTWPRGHTLAPPVGLEPTTTRLTAECSTDWAKEDYPENIFLYLQNYTQIPISFHLLCSYHLTWLCPRPISNSQLHALLHFHLCPIYLVVFKGSYNLRWDISSWGGLHA